MGFYPLPVAPLQFNDPIRHNDNLVISVSFFGGLTNFQANTISTSNSFPGPLNTLVISGGASLIFFPL